MRRGTRWFTRKGLVWGLATALVVAGSVAAAAAAPATEETKEAEAFTVRIEAQPFVQSGGQECLFAAIVTSSGGTPPFTHEWSGLVTGTGKFLHAFVLQSGMAMLTTMDSSNPPQMAMADLPVEVGSQFPPCTI